MVSIAWRTMRHRLADLLEPDDVPVEAVAVLPTGIVEVELVVRQDGLDLAEVEVDARGPQVGAGDAVLDGLVGRDDADALGAGLDHLVAGDEVVELVTHVITRSIAASVSARKPGGKILGDLLLGGATAGCRLDAADPVEVGVEAAAGDALR